MEINKETIEKLAKLMYDGFTAKLIDCDENFKFKPAEYVIALSAATRVALLVSLNNMNLRAKMPNITDEQLLEAFGEMMRFSMDESIEIAQKYDQE
jgi:hypothetical protein